MDRHRRRSGRQPRRHRHAPCANGRLELFEYTHPDAIQTEPTRPNEVGMRRVAFPVDDIDEAGFACGADPGPAVPVPTKALMRKAGLNPVKGAR